MILLKFQIGSSKIITMYIMFLFACNMSSVFMLSIWNFNILRTLSYNCIYFYMSKAILNLNKKYRFYWMQNDATFILDHPVLSSLTTPPSSTLLSVCGQLLLYVTPPMLLGIWAEWLWKHESCEQSSRYADRQAGRQAGRQTGRHTDRRTDGQTKIY